MSIGQSPSQKRWATGVAAARLHLELGILLESENRDLLLSRLRREIGQDRQKWKRLKDFQSQLIASS